jgi:hypothetical protein
MSGTDRNRRFEHQSVDRVGLSERQLNAPGKYLCPADGLSNSVCIDGFMGHPSGFRERVTAGRYAGSIPSVAVPSLSAAMCPGTPGLARDHHPVIHHEEPDTVPRPRSQYSHHGPGNFQQKLFVGQLLQMNSDRPGSGPHPAFGLSLGDTPICKRLVHGWLPMRSRHTSACGA